MDDAAFIAAIQEDPTRLLSAATLVESSLVILHLKKIDGIDALDQLISQLEIEIVAVDRDQAYLAREAFRRFGKGRDKAGLNFGDCFSYALAKQTGEPLLFKGDDFTRTDLVRA